MECSTCPQNVSRVPARRSLSFTWQGSQAAAEFDKLRNHPGLVQVSPLGALAFLGVARAYATQLEIAKARAAYQDFLTIWKDADPDIPILKQAKAEYGKLQ